MGWVCDLEDIPLWPMKFGVRCLSSPFPFDFSHPWFWQMKVSDHVSLHSTHGVVSHKRFQVSTREFDVTKVHHSQPSLIWGERWEWRCLIPMQPQWRRTPNEELKKQIYSLICQLEIYRWFNLSIGNSWRSADHIVVESLTQNFICHLFELQLVQRRRILITKCCRLGVHVNTRRFFKIVRPKNPCMSLAKFVL